VILLPLRDENPVRGVPWVTGLLVLANVAAFVWQLSQGDQLAVRELGLVPAVVLGPQGNFPFPPSATLVTSMFLHGSVLHLAGNLVYLWVFGNNVEDVLGSVRFLAFYLLAGFAGHAAHVAVNPASLVPTVGASGAVAGILAAYLIRFPGARVHSLLFLFIFLRWVRLPAAAVIGYWLVLQVVFGLAEIRGGSGAGIAWFEHLGGFSGGALLFLGARAAGISR
jgi:membrane associated rhomboid family serine protease